MQQQYSPGSNQVPLIPPANHPLSLQNPNYQLQPNQNTNYNQPSPNAGNQGYNPNPNYNNVNNNPNNPSPNPQRVYITRQPINPNPNLGTTNASSNGLNNPNTLNPNEPSINGTNNNSRPTSQDGRLLVNNEPRRISSATVNRGSSGRVPPSQQQNRNSQQQVRVARVPVQPAPRDTNGATAQQGALGNSGERGEGTQPMSPRVFHRSPTTPNSQRLEEGGSPVPVFQRSPTMPSPFRSSQDRESPFRNANGERVISGDQRNLSLNGSNGIPPPNSATSQPNSPFTVVRRDSPKREPLERSITLPSSGANNTSNQNLMNNPNIMTNPTPQTTSYQVNPNNSGSADKPAFPLPTMRVTSQTRPISQPRVIQYNTNATPNPNPNSINTLSDSNEQLQREQSNSSQQSTGQSNGAPFAYPAVKTIQGNGSLQSSGGVQDQRVLAGSGGMMRPANPQGNPNSSQPSSNAPQGGDRGSQPTMVMRPGAGNPNPNGARPNPQTGQPNNSSASNGTQGAVRQPMGMSPGGGQQPQGFSPGRGRAIPVVMGNSNSTGNPQPLHGHQASPVQLQYQQQVGNRNTQMRPQVQNQRVRF